MQKNGFNQNTDPAELEKFNRFAEEWWSPKGRFRPVHAFNAVRLKKIQDWIGSRLEAPPENSKPFAGIDLIDVGCGGGLISEPLARQGARVVGVDASKRNIEVAQWHAEKSQVRIDYRHGVIEEAVSQTERFDVVLSLEVLEHVPDPKVLLDACSELLKPNGILIIATLDRTWRSYLLAILGAEYVLRWLPKGTHRWSKFIRPAEIKNALPKGQFTLNEVRGVSFNPLRNRWRISRDTSVNYMMLFQKSVSADHVDQ